MEKHLKFEHIIQPMNRLDLLLTTFFTSLNLGFFAFVSAADLNLFAGVLGIVFMILRNLKYCIMAIFEIIIFLKAADKMKIIRSWKREMKQNNDSENNTNTEKNEQ